jgi:hypothetical protein
MSIHLLSVLKEGLMNRKGMFVGVVGTLAPALCLVTARPAQAQNRRPYFPGANSYGKVFHPDYAPAPNPTPRVVSLVAPVTVIDGEGTEYRVQLTHADGWKLGRIRVLLSVMTDDPKQPIIRAPIETEETADRPATKMPPAATASR